MAQFTGDAPDHLDTGDRTHPTPIAPWQTDRKAYAQGQLLARPTLRLNHGLTGKVTPGLQPLGLAHGDRNGLLYVPSGYQSDKPASLVLMLHGAGGEAHGGIGPFLSAADQAGLILVAPTSRGPTWDVIMGGYGRDVTYVDAALAHVFSTLAVDPKHVAIQGFSDGASYALSLGLTNGDLFTHAIAFSPGFLAPKQQRGVPRLYVSHGTHDSVLPIDRCSRRIVPSVQRAGYDVRYHEFDGGHSLPPEIIAEALDWFLA